MMNDILEYLNELFPNPRCELNYNKDYELLIAVVLSAQTTDKKVNIVTDILFRKYPSLQDLANAKIKDVSNIIKPIGTYNKKSIYIINIARTLLEKHDGIVPNSFFDLEKMNGVGHKSASVVLGNIYNVPTFAVDTHVNRVCKRLGLCLEKDDVVDVEIKMKKIVPKEFWVRTHHQLVLFGRYYCTSRNPNCNSCKLCKKCNFFKEKC